MSNTVDKNLALIELANNALESFNSADTTEEKIKWLDQYIDTRNEWNSWNDAPKVNRSAMVLFTKEMIQANNEELTLQLACAISDHFDPENIEDAFYLNALTVVLDKAKTVKDESVANNLYSQTRFMLGEDNDIELEKNTAEILGNSILNNLRPEIKDQTYQAFLVQCFNAISQECFEEGVPEALSDKAMKVLQQYNEVKFEAITPVDSAEDKRNHWANHQIRTGLASLAINDIYVFNR
jgi:hypothetical protein